MSEDITYRWVDGATASDEDWSRIDKVAAARGWMSLSRDFSRILIAERGEEFGFLTFQALPYLGPLYVSPRLRGSGAAAGLVNRMMTELHASHARGFVVIAESMHTARMCEELKMERVEYPMYALPVAGGVEV
jgi:hypothetical protein